MISNLIANIVPKIVGLVIPTVKKLADKETPKVGQRLAEAGARLLVGGGAVATAATSIELPEAPESWMLLLQQLTALVGALTSLAGTIMVLVGKTQTTDNPDNDRDL